MWHLKKFNDNSTYRAYLSSDEMWIPRVAYILNGHTENIDASGWDTNRAQQDWSSVRDTSYDLPLGGDGKRWDDYITMGTHFIEFGNNGTLYFKDIQDPSLADSAADNYGWYTADVSGGELILKTPQGQGTFDGSIMSLGNYPDDYSAFGHAIPQN